MTSTRVLTTTVFDGEGPAFMRDCLRLAVEWCALHRIDSLVVFSGTGVGPQFVGRELLSKSENAKVRVVAVTPPAGRIYKEKPGEDNSPTVRAGVTGPVRAELSQMGIDVVSAHLPFKGIQAAHSLISDWARVADAYGVLGGGFALCIQAAMMACDAGHVATGERIVVASADTALVVTASRTDNFLSSREGLLVEHIICKAGRYSISKGNHIAYAPAEPLVPTLPAATSPSEPKQLPPAPSAPTNATKKKPVKKRATKRFATSPDPRKPLKRRS